MTASRFSLGLLPITAITMLAAIVSFPSRASPETPIHSFVGPISDGATPFGGLVKGKHGTLYGTTYDGGEYNCGTVFELMPPTVSGGVWTETVLYSFTGEPDGVYPYDALIFDKHGNLYGTTLQGGTKGYGTVFELIPPTVSGGAWTEAILYSFKGYQARDGSSPFAGLVIGWKDSLYGTTSAGGAFGEGTVFQLKKSKTGTWSEGVIHSFNSTGDGMAPVAGLIADSAGNLYGTTYWGGTSPCGTGLSAYGTVFELSPPPAPGEPWTEKLLHSFCWYGTDDGLWPAARLTFDSAGNLYGTTLEGGRLGSGTVFELSPTAGGGWTESVIYSFTGESDGSAPLGG